MGDVHQGSLGRLANAAEKRGWVSAQEAVVLRTLHVRKKAFAHIPSNALVRDIFKDSEVADLIAQATAVANRRALIHAVDGWHA